MCACVHICYTHVNTGVRGPLWVYMGARARHQMFFSITFPSHLISWTESFSLTRKLDFSVRLPRQPALQNCLNLLSSAGVTGIGGHVWHFYWILGVQIRSSGSHTWKCLTHWNISPALCRKLLRSSEKSPSQTWWFMSAIAADGKLRQGDICWSEASLCYRVSPRSAYNWGPFLRHQILRI